MDTKLVAKEARELCKAIWIKHEMNDKTLATLLDVYYEGYQAGLEKAREIYTEERQPA